MTVLPGASAVPTALVASGLPADRFVFVGFLARGANKLVEQVAAFDGTGAAVVAFEAPRRLRATLKAIGLRWPDRRLAVCRELTKMHEQVIRGTAGEVRDTLPETVRGEIVLVLEPAGRRTVAGAEIGGGRLGGGGRWPDPGGAAGPAGMRRGHEKGGLDHRQSHRVAEAAGIRPGAQRTRRRGCRGAQGRLLE